MNLSKLNPWNWFKHEDNSGNQSAQIPVNKNEAEHRSIAEQNPTTLHQGVNSLVRLHREFENMFDDVWAGFGLSAPNSSRIRDRLPLSSGISGPSASTFLGNFRANLDVSGDDKQYQIKLDVPGLTESELSIDIKENILTIKGTKEVEQESKDKQYYRVERSYGTFQRTLSIPGDGDVSDINAVLKDGVLILTIPRLEVAQKDVKRIPIST